MKKLVLLFTLFFLLQEAFASGRTIANHWRWSIDEGSITSKSNASWLKPVNVAPVISMPGAYRLRMLTFAEGNYTFEAGDRLVLEYREEPQSNSNVTIDANGIIVNNNSSTAGSWIQVSSENPQTSTKAFAVDAGYNDSGVGALKDRVYNSVSSTNLLYNQEAETGANAVLPARHENLTSNFTRRGGVGLSKNSTVGYGDPGGSGTLTGISSGGLEVEYRLVATKNAKPGAAYYFRLRNTNTSGNGRGTTDSWDYAAGYPSIAISNNYMGAVDGKLPNIGVALNVASSTSFEPGIAKAGTLLVSNGGTVASTGNISGTFVVPGGWNVALGSGAPSGWTLTGNTLTTTNIIPAPGGVSIPIVITPPTSTLPGGGVLAFTLGNATGNAGGDGTVFNNRGSVAVFKP
ncbi:hypothetical protein [Dyadobacter sp. CY312]|uniref:hypothetical protein n=1 Tax=Dyadobacter sp. CY312 TaxID=2907303 RepID=UPI001F40E144|nr:hypothetical protein [Dyadobacter sp. CY312]MCE7044574.1 hypothetical protein [Dyadobacter sp. CY312]